MKKEFLIKSGAYCAIFAGALRCFAAFASEFMSGFYLESLYFAIDICLLFAVLGFYFQYYEKLKVPALIGFISCMTGIGLLIGPDQSATGLNVYPYGAGILSIGLILISLDSWKSNVISKWTPGIYILSVLTGSVGFFVSELAWLFVFGGILFGISFIGMGFSLLKSSSTQ
ncbi:hypothetical protein JWG41_08890 [Leptospira sp. 201903075]|uniref:hypothetical protein n=1 Tax=Leptospira chreensis TaxID=2810035 RepID=UPI001963190B|nr:hypothetical protein [Leptospira chreensis]MBM9590555.1 hypothetical protein [Leptospira chreensis]